jgi:CYTH domain-containing protein
MDSVDEIQARLKYARVEREQRFLLAAVPEHAKLAPARLIHDRYLIGTRLRLRRLEEPGHEPVLKLGQKIRVAGQTPAVVAHTTVYLARDEYDALAAIPAEELDKSRRVVSEGGTTFAIDEFLGKLEGLVLAEVDVGELGPALAEPPVPCVADVTDDERFTGGRLAATGPAGLSILLREFMN